MKITIKKDLLLKSLLNVSKAISTKNLIPALAGVKFDLTKEGLTLTASDNDITIQTTILNNDNAMNIEEEGSIIIPGWNLIEYIKLVKDETIDIEVFDERKVIVKTNKGELMINGINNKEYPTINIKTQDNPIVIEAKEFKTLVNQTSFATSLDESRPQLTGINFKIVGNELECNATDSYRLARKIITLNSTYAESYNTIIKGKNIQEFVKILDEDDIEMSIFANKVIFKTGNLLFQTTVINGAYPSTANLIPKEFKLKVTVDKEEFLSVLARVNVIAQEKEKNLVSLEVKDKELEMKSSNLDIGGNNKEVMDIEKDTNENITISFSSKYMMEALKTFTGDKITLNFLEEYSPIIIKDEKEDNLVQLVLPIRTY